MHRFRRLLALCLLLASTGNAWSADGRVLSVEGDVRINGQPVPSNTEVNRNDTIETAAGASVKILLSDNSVLDIDSGSKVRLSDYSYNTAQPEQSTSRIGVLEGTLRYVSGLIAKENPEDVGFIAGNSTIGVRGSYTAIVVDGDGATVKVEAMIGEATLSQRRVDGKQQTVVVPTGQTTQRDPATGEVSVAPSTTIDPVNAVVYAIAAAAPDAAGKSPKDEGCSEGIKPLRTIARPPHDAEAAAAIAKQLSSLSEGDLMLVIAVLLNNRGHLCIDSTAVAHALGMIATVRPESAPAVVYVASLIDPQHSNEYEDSATAAAPHEAAEIDEANQQATDDRDDRPREPHVPDSPLPEVPPGGGPDPSPE